MLSLLSPQLSDTHLSLTRTPSASPRSRGGAQVLPSSPSARCLDDSRFLWFVFFFFPPQGLSALENKHVRNWLSFFPCSPHHLRDSVNPATSLLFPPCLARPAPPLTLHSLAHLGLIPLVFELLLVKLPSSGQEGGGVTLVFPLVSAREHFVHVFAAYVPSSLCLEDTAFLSGVREDPMKTEGWGLWGFPLLAPSGQGLPHLPIWGLP